MDEQAIVAALAQRIPKHEDTPAPVIQEAVKTAEQQLDKPKNFPTEIPAMKLYDFFGIERDEMKNRDILDMLGHIYQWVSSEVGDDSLDVKDYLRRLEGKLGLTFRPGNKLQSMYRYLKLDNERRRIEKELANV